MNHSMYEAEAEATLCEMLDLVTRQLNYEDQHEWIRWAWLKLTHSRQTPSTVDEAEPHYTSSLIALCALGYLYDQFCEISSGLDETGEPSFEIVGDERPWITEIELGRYCNANQIYAETWPETAWELVNAAIIDEARTARLQLKKYLSSATLFSSLYLAATTQTEADFTFAEMEYDEEPDSSYEFDVISDEVIESNADSILNTDVSLEKQRAFSWIEAGFIL